MGADKLRLKWCAALAAMILATSAVADTKPLSEETGQAILKELRQIRRLLETQQPTEPSDNGSDRAPSKVELDVSDHPALGSPDAPLIMVEFTDYECPFCQRFHRNAFKEIKRDYIDTGKLRYVHVDLPLDMHANARQAAHAARCAENQDEFWTARSRLIQQGHDLSRDRIDALATELGLNKKRYRTCMKNRAHADTIDADLARADKAGITGTPSFILGRNRDDARVQGTKIVGAKSYSFFRERLDTLLGEADAQSDER